MVVIEVPQRMNGGACMSFEDLQNVSALCKEGNAHLHMDGARLWEAAPGFAQDGGQDVTLPQITALFDSVYVSFYKGMGASTGAMLLGDADFVKEARGRAKMMGGIPFSNGFNVLSCQGRVAEFGCDFTARFEAMKRIYRVMNESIVAGCGKGRIRLDPPDAPRSAMCHVYITLAGKEGGLEDDEGEEDEGEEDGGEENEEEEEEEEEENEEEEEQEEDPSNMKVADLRTSLERRGIDSVGLKKELQGRLREALDMEMMDGGASSGAALKASQGAKGAKKRQKRGKGKGGSGGGGGGGGAGGHKRAKKAARLTTESGLRGDISAMDVSEVGGASAEGGAEGCGEILESIHAEVKEQEGCTSKKMKRERETDR